MASSPVIADAATVPITSATKFPLMSLILAMLGAAVVCAALVGSAGFYLLRSGKLPLQGAGKIEAKAEPAEITMTHVMVLEPMVVNLADATNAAYLKLSLTLRIVDEALKKGAPTKEEKPANGISDAEAAVRDTVLTVVGEQSADKLLLPDGKAHLKAALRAALAEHNPELKVMDLYFVDFLVQR